MSFKTATRCRVVRDEVGRRPADEGLGGRRLRADGTIVPRNGFVGELLHRVDLRLQRRFRLGHGPRATGLVELFNVFSYANYGGYSTAHGLADDGQPTRVANVAYYMRKAQRGFRFAF